MTDDTRGTVTGGWRIGRRRAMPRLGSFQTTSQTLAIDAGVQPGAVGPTAPCTNTRHPSFPNADVATEHYRRASRGMKTLARGRAQRASPAAPSYTGSQGSVV